MKHFAITPLIKRSLMQKVILAAVFATVISACTTTPDGRVVPDSEIFGKESVIPLGGGILGAVICRELFDGHGSRDGWTAACGAAGYFASKAFVKQHNRALEYNKVGQTSSWQDPDGAYHSVTPTRTYSNQSGAPCREFRQTVEIDGKQEILTGSACRQNDGTWALVN